jgi:oligopeptide/dipeptide ABC transporter ATP-binding protein
VGTALLEVEQLGVELNTDKTPFPVVQGVTMSVATGEAVGLVGESGSGKSMTSKAIMRLLPRHSRTSGRVEYDGRSIPAMSRAELANLRRTGIGMIFQDPRMAINPLRTVGDFLTETLRDSGRLTRRQAKARAAAALAEVGIRDAERRLRQYPHQLSGGLLQRVMIASVLLAEPALVIADEPTTALDVTTQQEVVAILDERRREHGMALIFITHDLDLATAITDRIAVMYAGMVVETAASATLHERCIHPYTRALLASRPSLDRTERLQTIPGRSDSAFEVGPGCVFVGRCPFATATALAVRPELGPVNGQIVACHRANEIVRWVQNGGLR